MQTTKKDLHSGPFVNTSLGKKWIIGILCKNSFIPKGVLLVHTILM